MHFKTTLSIALILLSVAGNASAGNRICAIYPHLKDSYWLSVNYGMVEEAKQRDVTLQVFEAGGYPNHQKQRELLEACKTWQADAIILGTVAPELYEHDLATYVGEIPVFATVNELKLDSVNQKLLKGEVGVDWYWMGFYTGQYLANKHPEGSGKTDIILLPGPQSSGGTKPVLVGFYEAIKGSDIHIASTDWSDNDKELQRNLVQKAIDKTDVDYIVGSAVAIEAAISELRAANATNDIGLISTYLSHGVYRGLLRHKVEFAPTDKMVLQGRMSLVQADRYLNGEPYNAHQQPDIETLTPDTLNRQLLSDSLSPSKFRPIFSVGNEVD